MEHRIGAKPSESLVQDVDSKLVVSQRLTFTIEHHDLAVMELDCQYNPVITAHKYK